MTAPCDLQWLNFTTTNELPVLDAVFGQERAVQTAGRSHLLFETCTICGSLRSWSHTGP